jgi:KipI family sensor histidine kinase inhibitor
VSDEPIRPFGEAALLVALPETAGVHALAEALRADPPPGYVDSVPGLAELLVEFDPLVTDAAALTQRLRPALAALPAAPPADTRRRTIPVVYGGAFGPDLEEVAALTELSPAAVAERHAASEVTVRICGFAPGFAYLGDLPEELSVPRLPTPRTRTPAGSVAVAGRMTGIYPAELPGGWRVIGRTPLTLFDSQRDPPAYLAPGDRVRFEPIGEADFGGLGGPASDW